MINILVLTFLFSLCIPFILLYIFEVLYTDQIYLYSTAIEAIIFAFSFNIFTFILEEKEKFYIQDFTDKRTSSIFRSQFHGPYQRNVVTDEVN